MNIRFLCWLAAVLLTLGAFFTGTLNFAERPILEKRFELSHTPANTNIVLIEIDPKSLRDIGTWPWKRSLHALLIDRLTAANVDKIIFDVDFSLASNEKEDKQLEAALSRRSGETILAAFRQWSEADNRFVDIEPLARFRQYTSIASANIFPASDGLLWQQPTHVVWQNGTIPSLSFAISQLINPNLSSDSSSSDFWIDYGISLDSLERYSFSDVAGGLIDPAQLKDKIILIGATAIELGDNVAVPVYNSLPGVHVQMLAAQSLILERNLSFIAPSLTILILLIATSIIPIFCWNQKPAYVVLTIIGCNVTLLLLAIAIQSIYALLVPITPVLMGTILTAILIFLVRFQQLGIKMINERLAKVKSQAFLANVAQNAFDALITIDAKGRIKTANAAAHRIFNLENGFSENTSIDTFIAPLHQTKKLPLLDLLGEIERTTESSRILCNRQSGESFHADLAVTSLPEEEGCRILLLRDIEELVKAEEIQKQQTKALEIAKTEAELANRSKTEFLANMNHELKTPLNAIMGFAEILKGEMFGPLGAPKYVEYSNDIYNGGSRLLGTVTDILDFARIEDGDLQLNNEDINLNNLVTRICEPYQIKAKAEGIQFSVTVPDTLLNICSDERLIKQSLAAVLSNAIKFNRKNGSIDVELSSHGNNEIRLAVSDTGIGIAEEEQENCFAAFGQANKGLNRTYEGVGLGLTFTRKYSEMLGFKTELNSALNEGTTLTFIMPAQ